LKRRPKRPYFGSINYLLRKGYDIMPNSLKVGEKLGARARRSPRRGASG